MSRIGRKVITLPGAVKLTVADGEVRVKGPKGELARAVVAGVSIEQEGEETRVLRSGDSPRERANHGLMRALLANMVRGVSTGFERRLEIVGVGYKAEVKGTSVVLSLGYSHPVVYPFPNGITIEVDKGSKIVVKGIDKERVGQTASELRAFRPPDSYKGKGLRYEGEEVRIKAGKSGQ